MWAISTLKFLFARIDDDEGLDKMGDLNRPIDDCRDFSGSGTEFVDREPAEISMSPHGTIDAENDPNQRPQLQSAASADELRRSLINSILKFERDFRVNHPLLWLFTLVGPMLMTIGLLVAIGLLWGWGLSGKFVTAALVTFFVLGRFVILGGVEGETTGWMEYVALTPGQLFLMVTYMDFMVALFVTFHIGMLFRLPWVGEKLATLVSDGKFIMDQYPWMRKLAFIGLVTFVIFPTSTTGSIGGSIFGRLLGLGRLITVLGVLVGSVLGNGIMYFFAKEINKYIGPNSWWLKLIGIIVVVVAFLFLEWRYRQTKKKFLAGASLDSTST